ncbi:MAG TPA: PaaI family thioesterase [Rhizomicrobium sp.]
MSGSAKDIHRRFSTASLGGTAFFEALGARVTEIAPGRSMVRLPYAPHIVGNPDTGVVHGGVITGLLDQACGIAVGTALAAARRDGEPLQGIATLDLRIDYLKAARPGADIVVVGECVKITRQIVFARGRAFQDDADAPIALAAATFMVTELQPAAAKG